jgi:NAD(P)-dependent dehydrogenase (short-subunit alcohol dehydrogenase family)
MDMTDQKSLVTFNDYLMKEYGGIDALVNNAAIAYAVR